MERHLTWDTFFKSICAVSAVVLIVAIIVKLGTCLLSTNATLLSEVKLETLLITLAVVIILPYLGKLEAFGVKMEVKKRVDDLTARIQALPDYILASEYHHEGDYALAERSYRKSLDECSDFWPATLGLASMYSDRKEYDKAIMEYHKVLEIDPNNAYAFNDLADTYLIASPPLRNPQRALDMAEKALELVPSMESALYYKAEALNRLGRYEEARSILKAMLSRDMLPGQRHWIGYELAVAHSGLGSGISEQNLDHAFLHAKDNSQARRFLDVVSDEEERRRFQEKDIEIIRQFCERNREYTDCG